MCIFEILVCQLNHQTALLHVLSDALYGKIMSRAFQIGTDDSIGAHGSKVTVGAAQEALSPFQRKRLAARFCAASCFLGWSSAIFSL